MTYTLFLLRHAKANEKEGDQKDIDRVLSGDGVMDATRIGKILKSKNVQPSIIISSSAVRALATANIVAEQIGYDTDKIHINEDMYNAPIRIMLQTVNNSKKEWSSVLMVGHNPGISYLAEYVTGEEVGSMSPGSCVHIEFEIDSWQEVSSGNGTVKEVIHPVES